jgi:hypothetical protein
MNLARFMGLSREAAGVSLLGHGRGQFLVTLDRHLVADIHLWMVSACHRIAYRLLNIGVR